MFQSQRLNPAQQERCVFSLFPQQGVNFELKKWPFGNQEFDLIESYVLPERKLHISERLINSSNAYPVLINFNVFRKANLPNQFIKGSFIILYLMVYCQGVSDIKRLNPNTTWYVSFTYFEYKKKCLYRYIWVPQNKS